MECTEFQARWQLLLDQRQVPEQDLELLQHADVCSECGEVLQVQAVLFAHLPRLERRPAVLAETVTSKQRRLPSGWGVGWGVSLALAGALLVMVVPIARVAWSTRGVKAVVQPSSAGGWNAQRPAWISQVARPVGVSGGATMLALRTNSAADPGTLSAADRESLRKTLEEMAARIQDVPAENIEPLGDITGGLKPLATTLGAAWDALLNSLPMEKGNEPQKKTPQSSWNSVWSAVLPV